MTLVEVACPLCTAAGGHLPLRGASDDHHILKYGDLYAGRTTSSWVACRECGFVHQNPRPSLAALERFYAGEGYFSALPAEWRDDGYFMQFVRGYYAEKVAFALRHTDVPAGSVFEAGAGHGGVLRLFAERGWSVAGVEPNDVFRAKAEEALGPGVVLPGGLGASTDVRGRRFDLIFSNHALEHVADLDDFMRGLARLCRPGTTVFTCVPTYARNRSFVARRWMNSAHYSMFTHRSLGQLFARAGLEEVTHSYRAWDQEVDDLWHVARFTGRPVDPRPFYEDPRAVKRYHALALPLNALLHAPGRAGRRVVGAARGLALRAARRVWRGLRATGLRRERAP